VAEDRGFCRRGEAIFPGVRLKLWPRDERAGDIFDKTSHAAVRVMAMGRLFRYDKQMAFVRDAKGAVERAQDEVVDIRVWIGMFVDPAPIISTKKTLPMAELVAFSDSMD
jgi:hypothetical protein